MRLAIDATVARGAFTLDAQAALERGATGIFGPSGSGKSTLLGLIAGLVRPDRGRVVLDGEVLDDVAAGIHVPPHRRRLGVVFQAGHLLPHLDVAGNLGYGEHLVPPGRRRIRRSDVVEILDLGSLLARRPRTLSGGERQRVALGRALLCSPRLLLLDEPLAALDAGLKAQILPYLRQARDAFAIPVLHVSHDLGELLHTCDDLLLIERGRMAAHGRLADLARDPALLPQLHAAGLVNVLRGTVAAQDDDGLTQVDLDGGARAACIRCPLPAGARIELLLRPDDIALALAPVAGISLQNQIPGIIRTLVAAADRAVVQVDIGQPLLVEISNRAVAGFTAGMPVTVLFKALSLTGR